MPTAAPERGQGAASHPQIRQVTERETQGQPKGKFEAENKIPGQAPGFQKKAAFWPKRVLEATAGAKNSKSHVHTWSLG